ncbi:UDP-2,4-diacetamido-2,4,6-trideoxy-beta-L-altropyranose hydrolase [compost metagenome]
MTNVLFDDTKKNIAFRVDASLLIGTGHLMRCLTLADELMMHDMHSCFISRHMPIHLRDLITNKGHEFVFLDTMQDDSVLGNLAHSKWLGISQEADARDTMVALSSRVWDWLVVDHYGLDISWERLLRNLVRRILVVDDIADRQHDCDVLVDQNLYVDMDRRYNDKVPEDCDLLLGPQYALLRKEFRHLREQMRPGRTCVKNLLVFFGGVDADNCTGRVIDALSGMNLTGVHISVVIGAQQPFREQIEVTCRKYGFICYIQTDRMAELMAEADLAIGAGGSSCWERCCVGLPALLVSLADNQIEIAKALDLSGVCSYVGTFNMASTSVLRDAIGNLLISPEKVNRLSQKAFSIVDGLGATRVSQVMIG